MVSYLRKACLIYLILYQITFSTLWHVKLSLRKFWISEWNKLNPSATFIFIERSPVCVCFFGRVFIGSQFKIKVYQLWEFRMPDWAFLMCLQSSSCISSFACSGKRLEEGLFLHPSPWSCLNSEDRETATDGSKKELLSQGLWEPGAHAALLQNPTISSARDKEGGILLTNHLNAVRL